MRGALRDVATLVGSAVVHAGAVSVCIAALPFSTGYFFTLGVDFARAPVIRPWWR